MALAAIDPWAVDFERLDGDDDLREEALERFQRIVDEHPDLDTLGFVDGSFWRRYCELAYRLIEEDPRTAAQMFPLHDCSRLLARLQCDSDPAEDRGSVTMSWLMEVCRVIRPDDDPDWRDPVIFIPRDRQGRWPTTAGELAIVPKGVCRLVVPLEAPDDNALFVRDFDPWQCERARQTADDHGNRDLPRPAACAGVGMDQWGPLLHDVSDNVDASMTHLAFVPPRGWSPQEVVKADWRECPFGNHVEKIVPGGGRKKGPADRRERVWEWDTDPRHRNHWDVQHESPHDARYMNIFPNGAITKHYAE